MTPIPLPQRMPTPGGHGQLSSVLKMIADRINGLIDYSRAITPVKGEDSTLTVTATGTVRRPKQQDQASTGGGLPVWL